MTKRIRIIFVFVVMLLLINGIKSYASENEQIYVLSPEVPEEINEYANGIVDESLTNFMKGNSNKDIYINEMDCLFMGHGFYAFDSKTGKLIDDIVYFPIFESDRYVLTLAVVENEGNLESFMTNYFDTGFQGIEKNTSATPYAVLYDGNQNSYLLTESGQSVLQGRNDQDISLLSSEALFDSLKKKYGTNNLMEEEYKIRINDIPLYDTLASAPQGFSINTSTTKRLNMSNCLLLQYDESICWAASLGTAYRYRTGNRSVDAGDICDMLGMPHDGIDPTIVYQKYNILNVAGAGNRYSYKNRIATPIDVQHNINNMFPLHLHTDGHGMLVEGYLMSNGAVHLYYWDPAVGKTVYTNAGYTENTQYAYLIGAGKSRKWNATTLIQ